MTKTLVLATDAPVVSGPPQGQWTAQDWEALPDDGHRYEIIDGVLYMSTAPSFFHQWIIGRFHVLVGNRAYEEGLGFGIGAPIGVFMPGMTPVQPDYLIVLAENAGIIRDRRIFGVPDLIVEVLSPGSAHYDEAIKRDAYARAGVPEYALIDPRSRQLKLHRRNAAGGYDEPVVYHEADTVTFACLPTLSFGLAALFAGAPDTTL
jgi:Uma2 family endonuclease